MKKILLFVTALAMSVPSFAQSDDGEEEVIPTKEKKSVFFVGAKIGGTLTSMSQPNDGKLYDGVGIGFSGGLAAKARFGKASDNSVAGTGFWGVGIELKYKNNCVKTVGTDESGNANSNLSIGYFEVPVYVQMYPFYKSNKMNTLYVEAGPDFAGTIGRSPKTLTVDNPVGDFSSITYNINNGDSKLKGMDLRVMFGLGYDFPIKNSKHETAHLIGVNARYYVGTSKLARNFPCKMNSFELSLSWMFKIGKL